MDVSLSPCQVPPEQLPINEYQELSTSWFFRWGTLNLTGYLRTIVWVWGLGWIVAGPIAAASFAPGKYPLQFVLVGSAGASLLLALTLVRLYLGWFYIQSRLLSTTVFYEETGWYDGQIWPKPAEVLTQDHLVSTYQVRPILQRLRYTLGLLALVAIGGSVLWTMV